MILSSMLMVLAGGAICRPAWGAAAMVIQGRAGQSGGDAPVPALLAEPGEANRVRIAAGPSDQTVLIEDLGAVLTVGQGCVAVDAHHARCQNDDRERVLILAGDLDDVVVASPGIAIDAGGGPGVDRLTGADRSDELSGSGGAGDVLAGMGADDVLRDGDGFAGQEFEGNVVFPPTAVDADAVDAGTGNDVVSHRGLPTAVHVDLGDPMPDGQGGAGRDLIDGGAGADSVDGGDGPDRIRSAAGADVVTGGNGDDRISLGGGDDDVYERRQRSPDRDQITCDTGRDQIRAQDTHVGMLTRDCELFTAVER